MELEHAIGVIDIGSNSFHLVVGGYHNRDYFKIIDDLKVNVRLCEGIAETGRMNEERMQYGEDTLIMFKELCKSYHLDNIITIATAAVRKAENGPEFVERIRDRVGIDIDVIPGEREAELDYLGCINSIDFKDGVMMDIGGGSTELCLIRNREKVDGISLPFGSIDLMEMFDLGDKVDSKKLKKLRQFLRKSLREVDFLADAEGLPVIGIGGTIRNIGRVYRNQIHYPLEIAHNYRMRRSEVEEVVDLANSMNYKERRDLPGLSKGRTDIFPGASYACMYLMEYLNSDQLIISDAGIRNGVLYDYFGHGPNNLVENILDRSLINTMLLYDCNIPHAYHLLGIANKLSKDLKEYSKIDSDFSRILKSAAMLHDIGIFIEYREHHEHSFYLILNAGIEGLTQKEILTSAFTALHHRTNKKVRISEIYNPLLSENDDKVIDEISLYLQMGEYLDRTMDGVVRDLEFEFTDDLAILHVTTAAHPVMIDMVEEECGKKFKRVFGKELVVDVSVEDEDYPDILREINTF